MASDGDNLLRRAMLAANGEGEKEAHPIFLMADGPVMVGCGLLSMLARLLNARQKIAGAVSMTFPVWMLLAFAVWTMGVLLFTVGVYRWSHILTGKVEIKEFRADSVHGEGWYPRAMRAHANCVENLPIFGAVVFALYVSGISGGLANTLAGTVLVARIAQSITHVAFIQTNAVAFVRFLFFLAQMVCFIWLAAIVVLRAL